MIGILTYHTGYNYGASLQAFALQTVITKMGISVKSSISNLLVLRQVERW